MARDAASPAPPLRARCFRTSELGRACRCEVQAAGFPMHLRDLLDICGRPRWFDELRQFMPPRTLEEALHALLLAGLLDVVATHEAAQPAASRVRWPFAGFA